MRFRHVLVHPDALARADAAEWRTSMRTSCPLCDEPYYAVSLKGLWRGIELAALTVAVQTHLARECPDHPHTFDL